MFVSRTRASFYNAPTDVQRTVILEMVRRRNPLLAVLSAPGGYGKSVAASQIAQDFQNSLWVNVESEPVSLESIADWVVSSVSNSEYTGGRNLAERNQECSVVHRDAISTAVQEAAFSDLCVVLDDVGREANLEELVIAAQAIREAAGPRTSLVVTARDISAWGPSRRVFDILAIGSDRLALSLEEARLIARNMPDSDFEASVVQQCYEVSQGQAALFHLLIRHPQVLLRDANRHGSGEVPDAVRHCLRSVVFTSLDQLEQQVLWCAALLLAGESEQIARCLPGANAVLVEDVLRAIAVKLPLLRVVADDRLSFRVHDLVPEALDLRRLAGDSNYRTVAKRVIHELASVNRVGRALFVAEQLKDIDRLAELLEEYARGPAVEVGVSEIRRYLSLVPADIKIDRPILLYLEGYVLLQSSDSAEALTKYELAEKIGSSTNSVESEASGLLGQVILYWNCGLLSLAGTCAMRLRTLLSKLEGSWGHRIRAWELYLSAEDADALELRARAEGLYETLLHDQRDDEHYYAACFTLSLVYALYLGDFRRCLTILSTVRAAEDSGRTSPPFAAANSAMLLLTAGRLDVAKEVITRAIEDSRRLGAKSVEAGAKHTLGLIAATRGDYEEAIALIEECCLSAARMNRAFDSYANLVDFSLVLRAAGAPNAALEKCEIACAILESLEWRQFRFHAHTECLASRLALGDEGLVYDEGVELRKELEGTGYSFYLLRLDMVLAEIERRRGEIDRAASRIAEHADHIRGEGSNWHMAMYTRAFPGLLGVFARALGPDGIPIHMLRMLLEPCATRSLELARPLLDNADWRRLVLRTLGKAKGAAFLQAHEGPPVLRVRLFGGLQVEGPNGAVPDKAWGKRKARLLFAMLAMNRGRDVPRDVLFERLWPDMPADKAQSNFYVTWSYMKKALAPDGGPCPYLEHRGGVCRIVPEAVHTDLAEFLEAAGALRKAKAQGDADAVISAAERMAELHSGELLAGDLYEDWCEDARVHARHELSDAMLAGAEALAERGAPERAVRLVRHALAFDPWREDLYQAALRYQIMAGQRSSAIETYITCRTKLAEDLGLDPSQETQRLYEQVLAMEDVEESAVPA